MDITIPSWRMNVASIDQPLTAWLDVPRKQPDSPPGENLPELLGIPDHKDGSRLRTKVADCKKNEQNKK